MEAEAPEERAAGPRSQEEERHARILAEQSSMRAEQYARAEAKKIRRNMLDRTRYHYDRMVNLEIEMAEARRNTQDLIVADILEDIEQVRAGAARAG